MGADTLSAIDSADAGRLAGVGTVSALLAAATGALAGGDARAEAELLLAHALGRPRSSLYAWPQFEPTRRERALFERLVASRVRGEPMAYLTGTREFWSLAFTVTPAVLIPRPETELLVELALAHIPADAPSMIADLGTGSGAIACALAHERPHARTVATDASGDALAVARANAERLGLRNIVFHRGNWCAALGGALFDAIVSNPPYIAAGDFHLRCGDLRREPAAALVSGVDGLDAIAAIVAGAPANLETDGWLLLEHGHEQGAAVRERLRAGGFMDVSTWRDLENRERVSGGQWRPA